MAPPYPPGVRPASNPPEAAAGPPMLPRRVVATQGWLTGLAALFLACPVRAADWPQWHYDAAHTAASPEQLAAELHLQWTRQYPALKPAWPDQPKMPFDA